jgi:hypothetical protein
MKTKLQAERRQLMWNFGFGSEDPHLVYANHDFKSLKKDTEYEELIEDLYQCVPLGRETLQELLRSEQEMFRQCLDWLSKDASIQFNNPRAGKSDAGLNECTGKWLQDPRVKFLDLHGLRHTGVGLRPERVRWNPWIYHGISFVQEGVHKDPLDMLCWHVLDLHLRGDLKIKRCRYAGCRRFLEPKNIRKIYCEDICRAMDHKKTPEQMKLYMREYRKVRRHCDSIKKSPKAKGNKKNSKRKK